jgi:hypothetical protein
LSERLPARLEVAALIRQVESEGGFATVLKSGDPDRGALVLLVAERGVTKALVERRMGADFAYHWSVAEGEQELSPQKFRELTDKRARFDPDIWLIELDIPDAERFIAETIASP